jgi:hypothetical protein
MNMYEENHLHVNGSFAMEFVVAGVDEHGLPMLELSAYPVVVSGADQDGLTYTADWRHCVGRLSLPLEDSDLSRSEVEALPLSDGWATLSAGEGPGLAAVRIEAEFGARAAVLVLQVLTEALLSEFINMDVHAVPYRNLDADSDDLHMSIQAMHGELARRVVEDAENRRTREAFEIIIAGAFSESPLSGSNSI